MDCNKDEAVRAKSIAEAKLEQKDFAGAKKFALKAQNLHPGLNGISQMLTTLDVYISSQKMINGKVDWYGVLGVTSTADDETIKKQYRKLALMLHPDKNKSAGADGAFKLISEAWGLLSDKEKRSAYNLITGRVIPSMVYPGGRCTHPSGPSGPSMESRFTKFAKTKPMAPKTQKKSAKSAPAPPKPSLARANQTPESFWTICGECKIKYEYHIMYRNMTILCPDCRTPFMAKEIPQPFPKSRAPKPSVSVPAQQQQQQQNPVNNNNNNNNNNCSGAPTSANNDWGKNVVLEAKKRGVGQTGPNIFVHAQRGPLPSSTGVSSACSAKVTISENKRRWPMHAESNVATDVVTRKRKLDSHGHIIEI